LSTDGLSIDGVSASPLGATMTKVSSTVANNDVRRASNFEAVNMQPTVRKPYFKGYGAFAGSHLTQMHY